MRHDPQNMDSKGDTMNGLETESQEPYIALPSEEDIRARRAPNAPRPPYDFGFVGDMSRLLAAHPRIGPPMLQAFAEIMFAPGALDRAEREMVAAVASAAQDCVY
jgi:alkylhydroperoxidase/carboxymuconolactone decarboxylase family protein YurZ